MYGVSTGLVASWALADRLRRSIPIQAIENGLDLPQERDTGTPP
jgi:hypothetical protein